MADIRVDESLEASLSLLRIEVENGPGDGQDGLCSRFFASRSVQLIQRQFERSDAREPVYRLDGRISFDRVIFSKALARSTSGVSVD